MMDCMDCMVNGVNKVNMAFVSFARPYTNLLLTASLRLDIFGS